MNTPPQIGNILPKIKELTKPEFSQTKSYELLYSLPNGTRVCIACSGGSDSVFLVLLFCAYFPNLAKNASILHLNHNLRGEESDVDEEYIRDFAKSLNLNLFSGKLKKSSTSQSEGELRDVRYRFFSEKMRSIGSNILLLGQQKNDIAETTLMRLSRASGLDGLSAPHEIRRFSDGQLRVRPLLFVRKEKIESILSELGVPWRVDSSNLCCDYFRNKVRNMVLPALQAATKQYDIVENFAESQKQVAEANAAIESLAEQYLPGTKMTDKLEISELRSLPIAIFRRILNKWLTHNEVSIKKIEFDILLQKTTANEPRIFNCLGDKKLKFFDNILEIVKDSTPICRGFKISWTYGEIFFPDGKNLKKTILAVDQEILEKMFKCDTKVEAYIAFSATLIVTNFSPDIRYTRLGHHTPRRLKDFLGRAIEQIKHSPVIFSKNEACWIPGLPVSEVHKIKAETRHALLLTYS